MNCAERRETFKGIALLVLELQRRSIPKGCPEKERVLLELNNFLSLSVQIQDEEPDYYFCSGRKEKKLYEVCENCSLYANNQ